MLQITGLHVLLNHARSVMIRVYRLKFPMPNMKTASHWNSLLRNLKNLKTVTQLRPSQSQHAVRKQFLRTLAVKANRIKFCRNAFIARKKIQIIMAQIVSRLQALRRAGIVGILIPTTKGLIVQIRVPIIMGSRWTPQL